MTRKFCLVVLTAVFVILMSYSVFAAPAGADITDGAQERGTNPTADVFDTEGGNITSVDVDSVQISTRWTGFYGNVSGGFQLADSGANVFYEWTVTDVSGAVVYAANDTVSAWTLEAAEEADMPANLLTDSIDNFSVTFDATEAFVSASLNVADTPYADTWQGGIQGNLRTYALLETGTNTVVFAGKAQNNANSFKDTEVDYQIIAPGFTGGVSYTFYLELP